MEDISLEIFKIIFGDFDGVFEDDPVNRLLARRSGDGALIEI